MNNKLEIYSNGVRFENPFLVGSGPPSTNGKIVARSFEAGWGGSVLKTFSLDHTKIKNIAPRYAKLNEDGKCIGFTNNELISDIPCDDWLQFIRDLKKNYPQKVVVASIMESPVKERWQELTDKVVKAGADIIELNFSCPHGMPEMKMGGAMGQCPEIVEEVTRWVKDAAGNVPVWAKMTPNITDICVPAQSALTGGADGIVAINTILSLSNIDMKTFRPNPNVKGLSAFGGYSYKAVRPIALRMVGELSMSFKDCPISGVGGIVDGHSAAEFMCMGATTLQVCTSIMLDGFKIIEKLKRELIEILDSHEMSNLLELKGKSLPFFGTMSEMAQRLEASKMAASAHTKNFEGDNIVEVSKNLSL